MTDLADRRRRQQRARRWRPRTTSLACATVALALTAMAHGLVERNIDQQGVTEMRRRGNDLAMVASMAASRLYASLEGVRTTVDLAGGDAPTFDAALRPLLERGFVSGGAQLDGGSLAPVVTTGAPLHLTPRHTTRALRTFARARHEPGTLTVATFGSESDTVIGYVVGPPIPSTGRLLYVELPISSYAALFASSGALDQLAETLRTVDLAVYAGTPGASTLLFGSNAHLDTARHAIVQPLQFGGRRWNVVLADKAAPTPFERFGPPAVALVGVLTALVLACLVELSIRRRAALVTSEQRHRLLLLHASDVVLQLDADLAVVRQSSSMATIFGHDPASLLGTSLVELVHPEEALDWLQSARAALARPGEAFELAFRLRDAGGSWRHVEATGTSLLAERSVGAVVLNVRDVTERRLAEEATARLASIVEATSDVVATIRPDGRLLDLNEAGRTTLGLAADHPLDEVQISRVLAAEDGGRILAEAAACAAKERTWAGELEIRTPTRDALPVLGVVVAHHDARGDVEYFSAVLRDISDRKSLEEQLVHQAFHDALTGLANRALLLDRLTHSLVRAGRSHHRNAVLLIDLDDFKSVNDSLGHLSGDALLVEVAHRLEGVARAGDTVARLGGDEFAIVVEDVTHADATGLAARLVEDLSRPFLLAEREVFTGASIGVALSEDGSGDAEHLLRDADIALYRVKDSGKRAFAVFEPTMRSSTIARLALRRDLARAVEREEFVLHYQPIVDLPTAQVSGVEALIRWNHPDQGLVSPLEFIPLAEETGAIVPLGRWALREATRQLGAWRDRHPDLSRLYVSVNVSGRQLVDEGFVGDVVASLGAARLDPAQLVLEITESVLVQRAESMLAQLEALRATGVRIAIDDFGTGYSSLSALEQLPVDILKIDKAFVDGVGDTVSEAAIVTAITRLSSAMGLDIVAEGIEREEQRTGLLKLACPHGQGYLFSRPMPPDDVVAALLRPVELPTLAGH